MELYSTKRRINEAKEKAKEHEKNVTSINYTKTQYEMFKVTYLNEHESELKLPPLPTSSESSTTTSSSSVNNINNLTFPPPPAGDVSQKSKGKTDIPPNLPPPPEVKNQHSSTSDSSHDHQRITIPPPPPSRHIPSNPHSNPSDNTNDGNATIQENRGDGGIVANSQPKYGEENNNNNVQNYEDLLNKLDSFSKSSTEQNLAEHDEKSTGSAFGYYGDGINTSNKETDDSLSVKDNNKERKEAKLSDSMHNDSTTRLSAASNTKSRNIVTANSEVNKPFQLKTVSTDYLLSQSQSTTRTQHTTNNPKQNDGAGTDGRRDAGRNGDHLSCTSHSSGGGSYNNSGRNNTSHNISQSSHPSSKSKTSKNNNSSSSSTPNLVNPIFNSPGSSCTPAKAHDASHIPPLRSDSKRMTVHPTPASYPPHINPISVTQDSQPSTYSTFPQNYSQSNNGRYEYSSDY